jgi:uncharacterized OsmC-like protein
MPEPKSSRAATTSAEPFIFGPPQRVAALQIQPGFAEHPTRTRVTMAYGVACDVDLGDRSLRVDLPRDACGTGSGPNPAQLLRASLGACLVMGYTRWALRLGVIVHGVELELACQGDERAQLAVLSEVPLVWQRLAWSVTLHSDAAEAELLQLVETAHRSNPMLAQLSPAIARSFELRIRRSQEI